MLVPEKINNNKADQEHQKKKKNLATLVQKQLSFNWIMGCQQVVARGVERQQQGQLNDQITSELRSEREDSDGIKHILITGLNGAGKTTLISSLIKYHHGEVKYQQAIEQARAAGNPNNISIGRVKAILLDQILAIINHYKRNKDAVLLYNTKNSQSSNQNKNKKRKSGQQDHFENAMENIVKHSETSYEIDSSIVDDIVIFWNNPKIQKLFKMLQDQSQKDKDKEKAKVTREQRPLKLAAVNIDTNDDSDYHTSNSRIDGIDVGFCLHFLHDIRRISDINYQPIDEDIFALEQYLNIVKSNSKKNNSNDDVSNVSSKMSTLKEQKMDSESYTDSDNGKDNENKQESKDNNNNNNNNGGNDDEEEGEVIPVLNEFELKDEYDGIPIHFYVYNGSLKRKQKTNIFNKILRNYILEKVTGIIYVSSLDFLDKYVNLNDIYSETNPSKLDSMYNNINYNYNYNSNGNYNNSAITRINKFAWDLQCFVSRMCLCYDTGGSIIDYPDSFDHPAKILFINKKDYLYDLLSKDDWIFDENEILREFDLDNLDFGPKINGKSSDKKFGFISENSRRDYDNVLEYIKQLFEECFNRCQRQPNDKYLYIHVTQSNDKENVQRVIHDCQFIVVRTSYLVNVPLI